MAKKQLKTKEEVLTAQREKNNKDYFKAHIKVKLVPSLDLPLLMSYKTAMP